MTGPDLDREFLRRMTPYVGETPAAARERHRRERREQVDAENEGDFHECGDPS